MVDNHNSHINQFIDNTQFQDSKIEVNQIDQANNNNNYNNDDYQVSINSDHQQQQQTINNDNGNEQQTMNNNNDEQQQQPQSQLQSMQMENNKELQMKGKSQKHSQAYTEMQYQKQGDNFLQSQIDIGNDDNVVDNNNNVLETMNNNSNVLANDSHIDPDKSRLKYGKKPIVKSQLNNDQQHKQNTGDDLVQSQTHSNYMNNNQEYHMNALEGTQLDQSESYDKSQILNDTKLNQYQNNKSLSFNDPNVNQYQQNQKQIDNMDQINEQIQEQLMPSIKNEQINKNSEQIMTMNNEQSIAQNFSKQIQETSQKCNQQLCRNPNIDVFLSQQLKGARCPMCNREYVLNLIEQQRNIKRENIMESRQIGGLQSKVVQQSNHLVEDTPLRNKSQFIDVNPSQLSNENLEFEQSERNSVNQEMIGSRVGSRMGSDVKQSIDNYLKLKQSNRKQ